MMTNDHGMTGKEESGNDSEQTIIAFFF